MKGLEYNTDVLHQGNIQIDLPANLTYMVFELALFILILRPQTFHLTKSTFRCVLLLSVMIVFGFIHLLRLWHAGTVNATMFTWWTGLTGLTIGLLLLGIILRSRQGKT